MRLGGRALLAASRPPASPNSRAPSAASHDCTPICLAAKGDATKDFLDVGHSASARKILLKRPLGVLCAEDAAGLKAAEAEKGCTVA